MSSTLTDNYTSLLAGRIRLPVPIEELHANYKSAKPFPHVVVENMFSTGILDSLISEMASMRGELWSRIEQDSRERTMRMRSATEIGPAGDQFLSIVHSAAFLFLLSEITGIWQLLPDPYLQGAGYAQMRRGDYFNIHSDRNIAYDSGLMRRLAMIVFLNKAWDPAYEGNLELWNDEATRCDVSIAPAFNRTVIFEVAYPNYHGVPAALACPQDRLRQSFILYYHTAGPLPESDDRPRTSIFAPRFYGSNRMTWRAMVRDMMPPLLVRALRKLTRPN